MNKRFIQKCFAIGLALVLLGAGGLPAQASTPQETDSAPTLTGGGPWSWPDSMGLNNTVWALLRNPFDGYLYAGGVFTDAGGDEDCDRIGRWLGSSWFCSSFMGLGSDVYALAQNGGILYAGGFFTDAGGDGDCDRIATMGGSAWDCPPGMGLGSSAVYALAHDGTNLYAGGDFSSAGGDGDCTRIGIWTGSAWDCPSGMSLGGNVQALAHDGTNLYAGGFFINAGADPDCDYIGIWTGSAWDCPSGMGLPGLGYVYALAWDGTNLYAGGEFTDAGGDGDCDKIGIWTGSAWDCPSGMNLNGHVVALLHDGSSLYAGGWFVDGGFGGTGDADCAYIGLWTGAGWDCPTGMGMSDPVRALALDGSSLYAGGIFTDAGGDADCDYICKFPLPWLFKDGVESGDFTAWSSVNTGSGNLTVGAPCALDGTYGACLPSTNDKRKQMIDLVPADEKFYYASFLLDPNSVNISGASDRIRIFTARNDATFPFIVLLRDTGSAYSVRLRVSNDDGSYVDTAFYAMTDELHIIGVEWKADTSPGAGDGYGALYIDGVLKEMQSGVDNDTLRVDKVLLGITSRMDGMVFTGTMYMDKFYSDNNGYPE